MRRSHHVHADRALGARRLLVRRAAFRDSHVKLCYTEMVSRTNVTLSVDEDLLREARILAAQEGTSVSRLLADRLEELIRLHKSYDTAKRRALARLRKGYRLGWSPPPSRDALHER